MSVMKKTARQRTRPHHAHQASESSAVSCQSGDRESVDRRPEAAVQRRLVETISRSPRVGAQRAMTDEIRRGSVASAQPAQLAYEFGDTARGELPLLQRQAGANRARKKNETGMPDGLKAGLENLSGMSMDDVRVHYNSDCPERLQALAYTQGNDIHVAPGQARHLPHEAWHVVQQKQGRVKPTLQLHGVAINDDATLEREADVMGRKAVHARGASGAFTPLHEHGDTVSPRHDRPVASPIASPTHAVQRKLELQNTRWSEATTFRASPGGASGVIFASDESSTLVIKPDVSGAEEQVSTFLHGRLPRSKKEQSWNIDVLDMRIATAADVTAIRGQIENSGIDLGNDARLKNLLDLLAPDTTMIQTFAPAGTRSFGRAMTDQVAAGGHLGTNRNAKTNENSPLKPLLNKPEFAISLGKAAAMDIFMGNFDRLIGKANLENLMINMQSKRIFLIDNVGKSDYEKLSGDRNYFKAWAQHRYVRALKAGQVADLATSVWAFDQPQEVEDLASSPVSVELVQGERMEGEVRLPFVAEQERERMRSKLEGDHISTIRENFQKGLVQGQIAISRTVGKIPMNLAGSDHVRRSFMARWLYLVDQKTVDEAWPE